MIRLKNRDIHDGYRGHVYYIIHGLFILCVLLMCFSAHAEIIFEDSFEYQSEWTIPQFATSYPFCDAPGTCDPYPDPPENWTGWLSGQSHCTDGPGSNNMYINAVPGYPIELTGADRSGSGKCLTFWDESCVDSFEDSDGQLSKSFAFSDDIYIRFYIKFSSDYTWSDKTIEPRGIYMHKLLHVRYWKGNTSSFDNAHDDNRPYSIAGIWVDQDLSYPRVWYYAGYRCEKEANCNGTPSCPDMQQVQLGNFNEVLGDGQWHCFEMHFKMNTNNDSTFHADGVHRFWLDGELKLNTNNIPWSDNGSDISPRRSWNYVSLGGNNWNRWTKSCSGTECEQWYAIDDVVISTEYIGPDYVIGRLKGDVNGDEEVNNQDVDACVNHILGIQDWGKAADVNEDGSLDVLDVQEIVNIISES